MRKTREPIVTVIRRGPPRAPAVAVTRPPPSPPPAAQTPAATPPAPIAPSKKRRLQKRERLAARAAPHADAIRRLLDEASAANGGVWPLHIHVTIAEALGVPRGVVYAFLGTQRGRRLQ